MLTLAEAAEYLGIGLTKAYEFARSGRIPTVRYGRKYLVPPDALKRSVERHLRESDVEDVTNVGR